MKNEVNLKYLMKKAKKADKVIVVGAGRRGQELMEALEENAIETEAFFDNNEDIIGRYVQGVVVKKPYLAANEGSVYIVAVDIPRHQEE